MSDENPPPLEEIEKTDDDVDYESPDEGVKIDRDGYYGAREEDEYERLEKEHRMRTVIPPGWRVLPPPQEKVKPKPPPKPQPPQKTLKEWETERENKEREKREGELFAIDYEIPNDPDERKVSSPNIWIWISLSITLLCICIVLIELSWQFPFH